MREAVVLSGEPALILLRRGSGESGRVSACSSGASLDGARFDEAQGNGTVWRFGR
jgi:hypothetical protein